MFKATRQNADDVDFGVFGLDVPIIIISKEERTANTCKYTYTYMGTYLFIPGIHAQTRGHHLAVCKSHLLAFKLEDDGEDNVPNERGHGHPRNLYNMFKRALMMIIYKFDMARK